MAGTVTREIIAYFEEHKELFNECIEDLDAYNGYLGDGRYYSMDELDELTHGKSATDLLNMAFFGRDNDTYHTDSHGSREYGAFNPNREYFCFNGYGNLISTDYKDYSAFLDEYAIEAMAENRDEIDAIAEDDDLNALFDEWEIENNGVNE